MTKQKQVQAKVRARLLDGKTITDAQCRALFKGTRLAAAIHRLRKEFDIETEMVYHKGDQYAKYFIPTKTRK